MEDSVKFKILVGTVDEESPIENQITYLGVDMRKNECTIIPWEVVS